MLPSSVDNKRRQVKKSPNSGMDGEKQPLLANEPKAHLYHYIGDFFNTLKAFIGTNYLALPYAFMQSGLAVGIAGVFFIATLTDHCCQLLVKCKYYIIESLVEEDQAQRHLGAWEATKLRKRLERTLGYGDLGRIAFGQWCHTLIQFAVCFTQYTTCVCYFVFLANAIFTIFPMTPALLPLHNATHVNNSMENLIDSTPTPPFVGRVPMLHIINIKNSKKGNLKPMSRDADKIHDLIPSITGYGLSEAIYMEDSGNMTTLIPANYSTTSASNTTTPVPSTTPYPTPHYMMVSSAPSLMYLVLIPLPFFLLTSLIRKLRLLSPLTLIASVSLFVGAFSVLVFLIVGFHMSSDFQYYKVATLPVFIGQLTSAYEGIGCILPIESSMEGNRASFPAFLHGSVYLVFAILTSFGILGYLRYGENVQQIILLSMPQHSMLAIAVDVTLIVSVLCTYPLQNFPIIQILEGYLFRPGKCCASRVPRLVDDDSDDISPHHPSSINYEERQGLLAAGFDSINPMEASMVSTASSEVAIEVPKEVAGWKRNVARILLTLSIMGFAILVRNAYVLVGALSGAIGCSLLAYILPCMIHLKIRYNELPLAVKVKDYVIIIGSILTSIMVLVVIVDEVVTSEMKHHQL